MKTNAVKLSIVLSFILLAGCSSTANEEQQVQSNQALESDPRDPLESVNRELWDFNWEILDKHLLRPAAVAYVDNTPDALREGLLNMAENLDEPSSAVSNLLQGKFGPAASDTGRFIVNSTIGLLGFFDVAKHMGLTRDQEDMGQAFGRWGIGTGPYLMLPAMGPSDPRSLTGNVIDNSYFPLDALNVWTNIFRTTIKVLEARGELRSQEKLLEDSLDSYVMVKDIYFQKLESDVKDGEIIIDETEEEDFEDFLDEIE